MTTATLLRGEGPHAAATAQDMSDGRALAEPAFDLAIIRGLDGFMALQPEWDALFARAGLPHQIFQSHAVLRHWARHYADPTETVCIVAARRSGRLVMIWPLVLRRRLGLATLRFMGVPVAQFGDVLVERQDEDALLRAGWAALAALGADVFELRKLRADSALARAGLPQRTRLLQAEQAPFADLDSRVGADGPGPVYPPRDRSNHRRRLRRLAERGEIAFATFLPGPVASEAARKAVAMKQAALLRHGVIAPAITDPRFGAFFDDLAGDPASPLRVATMSCAGETIGVDLSLDCKETSFGHVIATHPDHERGGVGRILAHHSFASTRQRGNRRFDLLAPADAYKLDHADGMTQVGDHVLPLTLKGRLLCALGLHRLRPVLKAASKQLPSGVARRISVWSRGAKG